jgi:hypothetical protein
MVFGPVLESSRLPLTVDDERLLSDVFAWRRCLLLCSDVVDELASPLEWAYDT